MKKYCIVTLIIAVSLVLVNCHSPKKVAGASSPAKSTYASGVSIVIMNNCTPCHFPSKGGNKEPFDNFANVVSHIDEIIRRIELTPGEKGFMPFKRAKLNDSTIAVFKQWKADGMAEN